MDPPGFTDDKPVLSEKEMSPSPLTSPQPAFTQEPPEFHDHAGRRIRGSLDTLRGVPARLLVPVVGTGLVALLASEPLEGSVLALLAFVCAAFVVPARPPWAALLPLMRGPLHLLMPILGVATLVVVEATTRLPGLSPASMAAILAGTSLVALLPYAGAGGAWGPGIQVRTAVIGSARSASDLARELRLAGIPDYAVVGRISGAETDRVMNDEVPLLGDLDQLGKVVEEHSIHLLVMTSEVSRSGVFEQVSRSCLHLPVRLWELSGFYEDVFGHVPVAEINAAWFQYIVHPKYRAVTPFSKRVLDVTVAVTVGLLFLPVLAIAAILIRRDGGPVFFRQARIGESGRQLTVHKLRTMHLDASAAAQWAAADDPRVTRVGRFLRRSHLDELPQLMNVLRGEMSLVGPRPEQPEFVNRLEEALPFYQRRHLMKPGITGWAQVRCGYAGSDIGSAWKLSHDLYYLKHRSTAFDLAILGETLRTLFADRRFAIQPTWVSFIHGGDETAWMDAVPTGPVPTSTGL